MEIVLLVIIIFSLFVFMKCLFDLLKPRQEEKIDTSPKFGKIILAQGDGVEAFFYRRLNDDNTFSFYDMKCNLVDQKQYKITNVREVNGDGCFFTPSGKKRTEPFFNITKESKNDLLIDTKPSNYYLDTQPDLAPLKHFEYESTVPNSDTQPVPTLKE